MTVKDAITELQAAIQANGKFSVANVLDSALGVAQANSTDLQNMLNILLTKQGVLTAGDQAAMDALLQKQAEQKKNRQRIRTRAYIFIGVGVAVVGTVIFLAIKNAANE